MHSGTCTLYGALKQIVLLRSFHITFSIVVTTLLLWSCQLLYKKFTNAHLKINVDENYRTIRRPEHPVHSVCPIDLIFLPLKFPGFQV